MQGQSELLIKEMRKRGKSKLMPRFSAWQPGRRWHYC